MFKKIQQFAKEKLSPRKRNPSVSQIDLIQELRHAGKLAKEKAERLRNLAESIPQQVRALEAYGELMEYSADEFERYKHTNPNLPTINYKNGLTPNDFLRITDWEVPDRNRIDNSIYTLSGMSTSVTGSITSILKENEGAEIKYFTNPPQKFVQFNLTNDLYPLLEQIDPNLSTTWKSVWGNLALNRDDSIKNAATNARTVVDEISWKLKPIYEQIKSLTWCKLDNKETPEPTRATRYAWIKYGDNLPSELKDDPSQDILWKSFGSAYTGLQKYVHTTKYDENTRMQVETAIKNLELGLQAYLTDEGIKRILSV